MFDHKLNLGKNIILCIMEGQFDEEEARRYIEKFKQGVDKLGPDMTIISDLREYKPTTEAVRLVLAEGTKYALAKGIGRNVRIVNTSVGSEVSNIQFNKTARTLGYKADVVRNLEEAKQLLGW